MDNSTTVMHDEGFEAEFSYLMEEIRAFDASPTKGEAEWEVLWDRRCGFLDRVEDLPATRENASIKAKAVLIIHPEGFQEFYADDDCTDTRLVRQILHLLAGDS